MKTRYFYTLLLFIPCISFSQEKIFDQRTGVPIIYSDQGRIFPDSWYSERINAKGESLSKEQYERSKKIVQKALAKYPVQVIKNNLKAIYVLNEIEFYGQTYGGTNTGNKLYLSNKGKAKGYTDFYLEQLFHAEFSSVLLRNYKSQFNETKWKALNAPGFKYGKGGVKALKNKTDSEKLHTKYLELGVLNQYSISSLENDFNAFAKNLFLPKQGFKKILERYTPIRRKRELTIAFYAAIDSTFSETFFDKFLQQKK